MIHKITGRLPEDAPDVFIAGRLCHDTVAVNVGDIVQYGDTRGVVVRIGTAEEYCAWCEKHFGHRPYLPICQAIEVRFD